jgi:hypothetical protein
MTPDITPAASADLRAIFDLLDANQLPRAGLEQHPGSTLVARENGRVPRSSCTAFTTACPTSAAVMALTL